MKLKFKMGDAFTGTRNFPLTINKKIISTGAIFPDTKGQEIKFAPVTEDEILEIRNMIKEEIKRQIDEENSNE